MKKIFLLILTVVQLTGCATNKHKRWAITGTSVAAGLIGGTAAAPSGERTEMHAVYWGAIAGLIAALVTQEIYSDTDEVKFLQSENLRLKSEIKLFQEGPTTLLKDTKNKSNHIKLYKIDQWVDDGPNRKYHRDQMIEIIPHEKSK